MTSEIGAPAATGSIVFDPHNCFACGSLNTNGLQLDLHFEADRCWTELAIPDRFQGWDGIAHGGVIATILDEVMAWSLVDRDNWGLTARLNVQFKRPVQVDRPVRAEGWITDMRRRVVATAATLSDGASGVVLATADGTYVAAADERKQELKARYGYRRVAAGASGAGAGG